MIFCMQLEDGDIICFQRPTTVDRCRYPDIPSFLEYVHNRQVPFQKFISCRDSSVTGISSLASDCFVFEHKLVESVHPRDKT